MKIFLAQQNYHIGNFEANVAKITAAIRAAKMQGGELIIFSELAVCGYPPRDFLEFNDFIHRCELAVEAIKAESSGIGVIVGSPRRNSVADGKDLFNSAFFLYDGQVLGIADKTLLPTYDIFDEYRYFEPGHEWQVIEFKSKRIALTVCEDIWNLGDNPLYKICPMDILARQSPDLMINISASPFDYAQAEERLGIVRRNVARYGVPMLYCNTVGSQTEIVFDGGSVVMDAQQNLVAELPYFEEALQSVDIRDDNLFAQKILRPATDIPFSDPMPPDLRADLGIEKIYRALVTGIRDYFGKMGFTRAIVASSGGIDSAVTLALACAALGSENVEALLLPSEYSTSHSVDDAVQLSQNLDNKYHILPIAEIFNQYRETLKPVFGDLPFNIAEENLQSRIRGAMVMALANKFNFILLNTSNKSELATGYGTLYGDMAGGLGVLGDLYKVQVYALARYINREREIIPANIITKAPSAELRPGQKDSDSLPEYEELDPILYQYIERRQGPNEIVALGHDPALVARILRMVNLNEYKRNQFCPIIRVSPKAFGIGRRVPIVGKYLS